jgi:hypothetical protein
MEPGRQFIRVVLRDKDRNPLALTPDVDAPQIHDVDSLRGARDLVNNTRHGYRHDWGTGDLKKSKVAHATIHDGHATDHLPVDDSFFTGGK